MICYTVPMVPQTSPPAVVIVLISFILSFLGFCNGQEKPKNSHAVNDKVVEIILSAPSYEVDEVDIATAKIILEQRLSYLAAEVEIKDKRFLLKLPATSLEDPEGLLDLVTRPGVLRFRIVKDEFAELSDLDLDMINPSPFGHIVSNASVAIDEYSGNATIIFNIIEESQEEFAKFTKANIGNKMAIVLDDEILIASVLQEKISSAGQITGLDSLAQAEEYARIFNSGELPFRLSFEEQRLRLD